MPYNERMAECRLGFNDLHTIPLVPENLPPDYVVVEYTCPCGEYTTQVGLHRLFAYHLMGRVPRAITRPRTHYYLHLLSALQADAIIEAVREEKEHEEYPDR